MKKFLSESVVKSWMSTILGAAILGAALYKWITGNITAVEFTGLAGIAFGLIGLNEKWLKGERSGK
jgi:hypothetical protein